MTDAFCSGISSWSGEHGQEWSRGSMTFATSNHYDTPNNRLPDCLSGFVGGRLTLRSQHPGGVNLFYAAGHVQSVKDSVALATWRGVATRSGGEVLPSDAF